MTGKTDLSHNIITSRKLWFPRILISHSPDKMDMPCHRFLLVILKIWEKEFVKFCPKYYNFLYIILIFITICTLLIKIIIMIKQAGIAAASRPYWSIGMDPRCEVKCSRCSTSFYCLTFSICGLGIQKFGIWYMEGFHSELNFHHS